VASGCTRRIQAWRVPIGAHSEGESCSGLCSQENEAGVKRLRSFFDLDAEAEVRRALGRLEARIQRQYPDVVALITVIRNDLFALRLSTTFRPSGERSENYAVFSLHASWTEVGLRLEAWLESQEGSQSETFHELEGVDVEEASPDASRVCRQWIEKLTSELVSVGDRVVAEVGRLRALENGGTKSSSQGHAAYVVPPPRPAPTKGRCH
jgi:hypothetical protein